MDEKQDTFPSLDVPDLRDAAHRRTSIWNRYKELPNATGCPKCGYVDVTTACKFCGISKLTRTRSTD